MGYILILLLALAGLAYLEYLLSSRKSKWPGLILPGLSALCSVVTAVGFVSVTSLAVDAGTFLRLIVSVLYLNIPTAIFLAVYFPCRARRK